MLRDEISQVKAIAREIASEILRDEAAQVRAAVRELVKEEVSKYLKKKSERPAAGMPAAAPPKNQPEKGSGSKTE